MHQLPFATSAQLWRRSLSFFRLLHRCRPHRREEETDPTVRAKQRKHKHWAQLYSCSCGYILTAFMQHHTRPPWCKTAAPVAWWRWQRPSGHSVSLFLQSPGASAPLWTLRWPPAADLHPSGPLSLPDGRSPAHAERELLFTRVLVRLTFRRTMLEVRSFCSLTCAPWRRLFQLENEAEARGIRHQLDFSGSVGEVVRDSNGGQDGDPLLHVVFLTLAVNH